MSVPGARRWWALAALAATMLVVGLDLTVLTVALPTLATDLHASTGQLQWFADSYNLVLAAALLPAGVLGDRYGRRKLLLAALVLFGAASLACAYAPSAGALIAGRAALGLGAAFLMPLSMAVLPVLFTPAERPRAIAIWVTATALGIPLGPVVGGWLLDNYWWGSVFLINLPLIAVAVLAVLLLLPESRASSRPALDPASVLTSCLGLVALTYGVIRAGEHGWGDPAALGTMAGGAALLAAFLRRQRRPERALIDLSLFRSASFTWGAILATVVQLALAGLMFTLPQFFQAVNGADALGTGLRLLPLIGGLLVGARVGGRVAAGLGAKVTVAVGFGLLAGGLVAGAGTGVSSGYGYVASWLTVVGVGLGFALPTAMDAALSALSAERSGGGSALVQALRQVGGAIGVAILGTVFNAGYRGRLDLAGLPDGAADAVRRSPAAGIEVAERAGQAPLLAMVRSAFVHGMGVMLWVCVAGTLLGLLLTLRNLPARAIVVGAPETGPGEAGPDAGPVGIGTGEAGPARIGPNVEPAGVGTGEVGPGEVGPGRRQDAESPDELSRSRP
ncbi:MAG TPA: MFS transporter [Mycobacteriales bacterium]|nr:MFS transporter [Mycobacteriales bacterium]